MAKTMLIDASHREEMRMAITDGQRLEEFETEIFSKKQLKGNIYLAKVIRIEPSLQAAFVEFGGNRQGFLPFGEIHPDYYNIPVDDRVSPLEPLDVPQEIPLKPRIPDVNETEHDTLQLPEFSTQDAEALDGEITQVVEIGDPSAIEADDDDDFDEESPRPQPLRYRYKIQEVIKRRQILLIQVAKEERGNKGAALTTYISLPGRYCVFMPNSGVRRGGISRKISDVKDRQRIRKILDTIDIPEGMSLIVRTAGSDKNKTELKKDFEYLLRLWSDIREKTLASIAPSLIYAEGDLIKRALRDTYTKDIEEVFIEGDEAYKTAKAFMKTMAPSQAKKVQQYKDKKTSLFQKHRIEDLVDQMFQPTVALASGGSIVIAQTEALVAIDVNSGKSTRERHIDETAIKTNLEAACEIARQIRLRDLGGLIVIDFIDMNERNHINQVERLFKESLQQDRARIQMGKISQFGLLELSRQRLRPSLLESSTRQCPHCHGSGYIRSTDSMALFVLRQLEGASINHPGTTLNVLVPADVDLYLLNEKRHDLVELESTYNVRIIIQRDLKLKNTEYHIDIQHLHDAKPDGKVEVETAPVQLATEQIKKEPKNQTENRPQKQRQKQQGSQDQQRKDNKKHTKKSVTEAITEDIFPEEAHYAPRQHRQEKGLGSLEEREQKNPAAPSETSESGPKLEGDEKKNRRKRRNFDRRRRRKQQESDPGTKVLETEITTQEVVSSHEKSTDRPINAADTAANTQNGENTQKKHKGWWKRLIES